MPPTRRQITLADGIILIAATAVGLWITRHYLHSILELPAAALHRGMSFMQVWYFIYRMCCMLLSSGMILSATLLILRMRQPRPRFRRLMRQPGTVACWAILLVVGLRALGILEGSLLARMAGLRWYELVFGSEEVDWDYPWVIFFSEAEYVAPQMCLAVAVAWALLLLNGQWHPEPSWIDRSGRILGIFYIIMIPLFLWLFPFSISAR